MKEVQLQETCSQLPTAQPVPQSRKQRWQHLQLQHTTHLLIYADPLPQSQKLMAGSGLQKHLVIEPMN